MSMKKIFKILCTVMLSFVMLFSITSCGEEKGKTSTMKCAPCSVDDIFSWNEEVYQEFFYLRTSRSQHARPSIKCTVNGEELTVLQQQFKELEEGNYTIVFYTPKDFQISIRKVENGERIEKYVSYVRKVTIKVEISSEYGNICDYEYRKQNGLWTDPTTQDWYDDCLKELDELWK